MFTYLFSSQILHKFFGFDIKKLFQLCTQGTHLASYRDFLSHSFYSLGDAVDGKPEYNKKYVVEISETVYVEDDPTKNCRAYPTTRFETFADCDNQYMLEMCKKAGVTPIWMAENFSNVSKSFTLLQEPSPGDNWFEF